MTTEYDADSIERAQAGVTESVRVAGAMLANCAFNLAQCDRLTERERRSLDESRKAWDAATAALPVPAEPVAQPADSGRVGDISRLTRYFPSMPSHPGWQMTPDSCGEWVMFRDVQALAAQSQGEAVALMSVTDDVTPVLQPLEGWRNLPNRNYMLYTAPPLAAQGQGDRDAYDGARHDLLEWKRRALSAESVLRSLGYRGIIPTEAPASPAGVPDATEVHAYLPPGYRMATRDGDYWPLFGDAYCTNHAFPTRELAALEAWKQAHKKLNDSMDSIRRFAAAPSAIKGGA